jgi:hypothetical protein
MITALPRAPLSLRHVSREYTFCQGWLLPSCRPPRLAVVLFDLLYLSIQYWILGENHPIDALSDGVSLHHRFS